LVAQDAVEEEIYKVIEHSNLVQVNFSTEFVGFEEVENGVMCEIRSVDTGRTEHWHAKYLLACDGAIVQRNCSSMTSVAFFEFRIYTANQREGASPPLARS
jgi:hypothetical protein